MKALDNLKQDHLAVERILNLIDEEWNRVQDERFDADITKWEEKFRAPVKQV